ncbi:MULTISPECIES: cellulose biosynthesis protein BcsG [Caballeronia]|uniref:cellulose biosynthesis protein BcsG n=1 Tax=Caballeronia TaxID=1827195 RepID=UPI00158EA2BB|nr:MULTISPECIES: cellulose biosynthesis protein BcsG [Caballeronia]MCG7403332.1 cellulose biosynthesis protein BcsG [Caballeronia zhejiangensis]MCI1044857.1 cellulose biosynthesis protein BcsG [Caballeronia zhejiangensis]
MTFWNLYFIIKIALFSTGHLTPIWLANIAFAVALAASSPLRSRIWRAVRFVAGLGIGLPLMYREANVPPFGRIVEEFGNLTTFSFGYWLELLPRFLPPMLLAVALGLLVAYLVVNRWLRVATFVMIALVALPVWQGANAVLARIEAKPQGNADAATNRQSANPLDYNATLAAFRAKESQRQVSFGHLSSDPKEQFDVIVLHICSLSWDDLDVSKERNHPFLSHFDYLFTNFSTAASYSGPAAIRVLRASCGQEAHADLYKDAPAQCHLMADLAQAGYTPQVTFNHDGHFDNFTQLVKENIGVPNVPFVPNTAAPVAMHAFDGSPIMDDYGTLANWYAERAREPGPVALYYNTISLHDGNRLPNNKMTSLESYPLRVAKLMSDFDKFADLIQQSGRRAVIVFVPEHGAALRGDANQVAGLREIPTPSVIHGPVGVRLVGFTGNHGATTVIDQPTGHLAIAQLLSNLVSNSPFKAGVTLSQYAANLPQTPMIGENEGTVTMKTATGYVVKTPDGVWVDQK